MRQLDKHRTPPAPPKKAPTHSRIASDVGRDTSRFAGIAREVVAEDAVVARRLDVVAGPASIHQSIGGAVLQAVQVNTTTNNAAAHRRMGGLTS